MQHSLYTGYIYIEHIACKNLWAHILRPHPLPLRWAFGPAKKERITHMKLSYKQRCLFASEKRVWRKAERTLDKKVQASSFQMRCKTFIKTNQSLLCTMLSRKFFCGCVNTAGPRLWWLNLLPASTIIAPRPPDRTGMAWTHG